MRPLDQKNVNVNMDSEIAERFASQVDDRGQKKFRAVEGALRLWISLPTEVQSQLILNSANIDLESVYEALGNRLREALHNTLALEIQEAKMKGEVNPKGGKRTK